MVRFVHINVSSLININKIKTWLSNIVNSDSFRNDMSRVGGVAFYVINLINFEVIVSSDSTAI